MPFINHTVLITGGATGIGFAMAEYLLEQGNQVIICGRREDKLAATKEKLPALHTVVCDVADETSREHLVRHLEELFPDFDFLINNAGIQRESCLTAGIEELKASEAEIDINLRAPMYLSVLLTPLLKKQAGAAILNVSSGLGFASDRFPDMPVYSATKAGLHAFTKAQRVQLAPLGIRVMEIIPPMVETELNAAHANKLKAADPERFNNPDVIPTAQVYVRRTFAKLEAGEDEVKY